MLQGYNRKESMCLRVGTVGSQVSSRKLRKG